MQSYDYRKHHTMSIDDVGTKTSKVTLHLLKEEPRETQQKASFVGDDLPVRDCLRCLLVDWFVLLFDFIGIIAVCLCELLDMTKLIEGLLPTKASTHQLVTFG